MIVEETANKPNREIIDRDRYIYVVVVYHVTIVAIGHGLLKKCWPLVPGYR